MNADIIAVGPIYAFRREGVKLEYGDIFYTYAAPDTMIMQTLAVCNTTDQSFRLAAFCGVNPSDVETHEIKHVANVDVDGLFGGNPANDVLNDIHKLLSSGIVRIWYRPNF